MAGLFEGAVALCGTSPGDPTNRDQRSRLLGSAQRNSPRASSDTPASGWFSPDDLTTPEINDLTCPSFAQHNSPHEPQRYPTHARQPNTPTPQADSAFTRVPGQARWCTSPLETKPPS